MSDYRDLDVWRVAHATRLRVYQCTTGFPSSEQFGLVSQARRAASSINANIAEGSSRKGPDFARYLRIAEGSANELEDHLLLAKDLDYIPHAEWIALTADVARIRAMLIRLRQHLIDSHRGKRATG
jgi:four helix bundle protein